MARVYEDSRVMVVIGCEGRHASTVRAIDLLMARDQRYGPVAVSEDDEVRVHDVVAKAFAEIHRRRMTVDIGPVLAPLPYESILAPRRGPPKPVVPRPERRSSLHRKGKK